MMDLSTKHLNFPLVLNELHNGQQLLYQRYSLGETYKYPDQDQDTQERFYFHCNKTK